MLEGHCHCGAVHVEVPTRPRSLTRCNCSICHRYGTAWAYYRADRVKIVAKKNATQTYTWGHKLLDFVRCRTCGCVIAWVAREPGRNRMGVNMRNFPVADLEGVRVGLLDGAGKWKFVAHTKFGGASFG